MSVCNYEYHTAMMKASDATDEHLISKGREVRENVLRGPVEVDLPMMPWDLLSVKTDRYETEEDGNEYRIGRIVMRSMLMDMRSLETWEWSQGLHEFTNTCSPNTASIHCRAFPSSITPGASKLVFEFRSRRKQFTFGPTYTT